MNELMQLIQKIEALMQLEPDPMKRMDYRNVIRETIRKFEQIKSA